MKWYNNLKISKKLISAFIITTVVSGVLIGLVGLTNIRNINSMGEKIYTENLRAIMPINKVQVDFLYLRNRLKDMVLAKDNKQKSQYLGQINGYLQDLRVSLDIYSKSISSDVETKNYQNIKDGIDNYITVENQFINLIQLGKADDALALLKGKGTNIGTEVDSYITKAININMDQARERNASNASAANTATIMMAGIVLIIIVISVIIGSFTARLISRPITKLLEVANKISDGNMDVDIHATTKDEIGELTNSFVKIVSSINALVTDANMLSQAAIDGNFETRADASKHQGEYRKVVEGVNATLDTVIDKTVWYEAIIDAIPFPIHVTDNDMNWTYMNKSFEKLMIEQGVVRDRKSGYGLACSHAGANICNTQNCGIKQLLKGNGESFFDWCGMHNKQDTSYLKNRKGENVGYVEVVTDLTPMIKVSNYTKTEVRRLEENLKLLSSGNIDLDMHVSEADKYTVEVNEQFEGINNSLTDVKNALGELVKDATMLSAAAIEGKLDTRADVSKHKGDYRKIVEGVNKTLDTIVEPLNEAERVLGKMSLNDLDVQMSSNYKGMLKELADSIDGVRGRLLSIESVFVEISKGDTSRLEEFRKIGKRSANDRLIPSMVGMMDAIHNVINESNILVGAAVNGDLSVRGNEDKFEGGYKEIIKGINRIMEAVVNPIEEASAVMQQMAERNLRVTMNGDYRGEYAKIKDSLNFTINAFNEVLNDINTASEQVASGSRQVSDGSQALSRGATEQASSIEQLTASITQVAAQTKENAVNANQANELALKAKQDAEQGNVHMDGMLNSMKEINEASSSISKIIKVIDDIAFQTNILALNAAVEAARAGQHGKGFAVVAEEVRNLAARSANAAKETTTLIEGSIKKAEAGTQIANETAKALVKIVDEVAKAANIVGEIASASNEQASAITQINNGIEQVSQVVQTNSATAEESASSSEELSSQAQLVKEMVSKFKLKQNLNAGQYGISENNASRMFMEGRNGKSKSLGYSEAAATSIEAKSRIVLSDNEFGKY